MCQAAKLGGGCVSLKTEADDKKGGNGNNNLGGGEGGGVNTGGN
jgi:hypothetical protein